MRFHAISLLAVAASPNAHKATQRRLDAVIARCDAAAVMKLTAQSAIEVLLYPLQPERPPTADESRRIECVFEQLKAMPDLQLGFLGNEEADDESDGH